MTAASTLAPTKRGLCTSSSQEQNITAAGVDSLSSPELISQHLVVGTEDDIASPVLRAPDCMDLCARPLMQGLSPAPMLCGNHSSGDRVLGLRDFQDGKLGSATVKECLTIAGDC